MSSENPHDLVDPKLPQGVHDFAHQCSAILRVQHLKGDAPITKISEDADKVLEALDNTDPYELLAVCAFIALLLVTTDRAAVRVHH